jgi:muramoyltetrapeptide carboxypeptidase
MERAFFFTQILWPPWICQTILTDFIGADCADYTDFFMVRFEGSNRLKKFRRKREEFIPAFICEIREIRAKTNFFSLRFVESALGVYKGGMEKQSNRPNKSIVPPLIKPGARIGVTAPSSHFNRELFEAGTGVLESMGFRLYLPDDLFGQKRYLAGEDRDRAKQILALFADSEIDAVICARGGFGSIRILEFLDFQVFVRHPKPLIGFSDATALLNAVTCNSGLVTFHGPTVTTLGRASEASRKAFFNAVTQLSDMQISSDAGQVIREGKTSGPLIGGNLTTLCHLIGTPFEPGLEGVILFLEDIGELPYRIDRMLMQMKLAGWLEKIAGLVLGNFENCGQPEEIVEIVSEFVEEYDIPALAGSGFGHIDENPTIPIGGWAEMDTDRRSFIVSVSADR